MDKNVNLVRSFLAAFSFHFVFPLSFVQVYAIFHRRLSREIFYYKIGKFIHFEC